MKIIGVELRYRHPMCEQKEIAMFACDIPLPPLPDHIVDMGGSHREVSMTIHTSEGDVNMIIRLPGEAPRLSAPQSQAVTNWFDRIRTQ